jgi:hypothetical protein
MISAEPGLAIDDRLECGVDRHVLHTLAVDPDLAAVAQRGAIFFPGSDHAGPSPIARPSLAATDRWMKAPYPRSRGIAADESSGGV